MVKNKDCYFSMLSIFKFLRFLVVSIQFIKNMYD